MGTVAAAVEAPLPDSDLQTDLAALRAELQLRRFNEHPLVPLLAATATHLALGLGGLAGFVVCSSLPVRVFAMTVSCFGFIGIATVGHTASHNAASDHRIWNRFLLYFTYPFVLQLSARFWHHTHVQVHHTAPNILGLDNDCDLRPAFAINESHQAGANRLRRFYWKYQGYLFPVALLFNSFNIQRKGWTRLYRELRDPSLRCSAAWIDLGCMVAHVAVWIFLPMFFFAPASVIGLYLVRSSLVGVGLFGILAPGHFPLEAAVLERSQRDAGDFYLRQTVATVNFRTGVIGRFLCAGLEYQIEHHLFPSVSHLHYRKMAPLVREFCRRRGMPHRTFGWAESIWKSYRVFFTPKRVLSDVEALRGPVERATAGPPS